MSHAMPRISKATGALVAILLSASISGCASSRTKRLEPGERQPPLQRVYFFPYEEVELAVKRTMIRYPQKVQDSEAGILETDLVKGELRFKPPHSEVQYSNGYHYKISVRMVKGKTEGRPAVKVLVSKEVELVRDFFSGAEYLPTDELEEQVILYRIQRELTIERAIRKLQEKANHSQQPS